MSMCRKRNRRKFCISDEEVLTLAKYAIIIEDHYSKKAGKERPMDIEWAKDGKTGELFIVQARPETVQSQRVHGRSGDLSPGEERSDNCHRPEHWGEDRQR